LIQYAWCCCKIKVDYNAAAVAPFIRCICEKVGIETPKTVQISGEVLTAEAYDAFQKEKGEKSKTKN
jgi:hypothetical protein